MVFLFVALYALSAINEALEANDAVLLLSALKLPYLRLRDVLDQNARPYLTTLLEVQHLRQV